MKTKIFTLLILVAFFASLQTYAQARLQAIHNSPDPLVSVVDVWLNDSLILNDFAFRQASPFVTVPSGIPFDLSIQPSSSTDTANALVKLNYTLTANQTYILIANGLVNSIGYSDFKPFNMEVYAMGQEMATQATNTDVLAFHGSPDAPVVDVVETGQGAGTIIDDFAWASFAGYLPLPTADYILEVRDSSGMNTVAAYQAPLSTLNLDGQALVLLASGFLNPAVNNNGPAFGLYAALPSGGNLVPLPLYSTARVQVIHNSPDPAAATVDIWLDDELLINDFAFRTASPFVDIPANMPVDISIAGPNSTDTVNAVARFTYTLTEGMTYVLVANGMVVPAGYNDFKPFNIEVYGMGQEMATQATNTDVLAFHGSPDAPVVDVVETGQGAGTIIDDFAWASFAGYLPLPTADYILEVRDSSGMNTVAAYQAPLSTLNLDGQALVLLASGFLNPAVNNNGPAFGLYAALPSGGNLVPLPLYSTARVQVIHNSPDPAAATVDIWLDDELLINDFAFRTASPFVDIPANMPVDISIAGPNSTDTVNAVARFTYTLTEGMTYVLVANGMVVPAGYNDFKPFNIEVYGMGQEMATQATNTDVLAFHGSPDAPVVDVVETGQGAGTIIDDFAWASFEGYLNLPTADYTLEIRDASGMNTVATYQAPLSTLNLDGQALVLLASGFLNPAVNNNGPSFGLFAALTSGGNLVPLPIITSINESQRISQSLVYPNPANESVHLDFSLTQAGQFGVNIYDVSGKTVYQRALGFLPAGQHNFMFPTTALDRGLYLLELTGTADRMTKKIQIIR